MSYSNRAGDIRFQLANYQQILKEMDGGEITLSTLRAQVDESRNRNADASDRKLTQSGSTREIDVHRFP